jgi:hypothetical protein
VILVACYSYKESASGIVGLFTQRRGRRILGSSPARWQIELLAY